MREGFEPSVRFRTHTFQACAFDHSATSPAARSLSDFRSLGHLWNAKRRGIRAGGFASKRARKRVVSVGMGKSAVAFGAFNPADRRRFAPAPKMLLGRILSTSVRFRTHTFQACAFDHSATSPAARSLSDFRSLGHLWNAKRRGIRAGGFASKRACSFDHSATSPETL